MKIDANGAHGYWSKRGVKLPVELRRTHGTLAPIYLAINQSDLLQRAEYRSTLLIDGKSSGNFSKIPQPYDNSVGFAINCSIEDGR